MDPESATFTPRDDLWRVQNEMLRVHQVQAELADRVSRLERRHDEDTKLKSLWGTASPFPSALASTPQQVPLQQPTSEHFSNFDDHSNHMIGNLHLDADEEPRRTGATSRANSVRFDETANQGHWAHTSRSSLDLIPRTGSGLGPVLCERSYSHKSDGRQSSAGHSAHSVASGRANSFSTSVDAPGLAPGLFILGSVPAIIRCWLNTDFRYDALLYAVVCTASYDSYLDLRLVDRLGFRDRIVSHDKESNKIKLTVHLPDAISLSASARSSSPTPQVPSLTVDFTVVQASDAETGPKAIQVFLGSDVLRRHNADVLFSSSQLTLYDDERNKLQIPLAKPEDEASFKSLFTANGKTQRARVPALAAESAGSAGVSPAVDTPATASSNVDDAAFHSSMDDGGAARRASLERDAACASTEGRTGSEGGTAAGDASAGSSPALWSNWRREGSRSGSLDLGSTGKKASGTYQRRDSSMKVLKPAKAAFRAVSGGSSAPAPAEAAWKHGPDGRRRMSTPSGGDADEARGRAAHSGDKKDVAAPWSAKLPAANVLGGASAFSWMNSGGHGK